jgi:ABC-type branched-subunit amino acid transport system ATPase component
MHTNNQILKIENLRVSYFKKEVLHDVSINIGQKEIVGIIGPNGAGKSTLLKAVFGLIQQRSGRVEGKIILNGFNIANLEPYRKARLGIGYLVQGGEVFSNLSVEDNLVLGSRSIDYEPKKQREFIYSLFPQLFRFRKKRAGLLSGGERQMLAIGTILMSRPKLLLLDEPTASLATVAADVIVRAITEIREKFGTAVLLVEQNIDKCLALSDRVYLMRDGRVVEEEVKSHFSCKSSRSKIAS